MQLYLCEEYRLLGTLVFFEVVLAFRNTTAGGSVSTESILAHGNMFERAHIGGSNLMHVLSKCMYTLSK